jgi:hypothetical protein
MHFNLWIVILASGFMLNTQKSSRGLQGALSVSRSPPRKSRRSENKAPESFRKLQGQREAPSPLFFLI